MAPHFESWCEVIQANGRDVHWIHHINVFDDFEERRFNGVMLLETRQSRDEKCLVPTTEMLSLCDGNTPQKRTRKGSK